MILLKSKNTKKLSDFLTNPKFILEKTLLGYLILVQEGSLKEILDVISKIFQNIDENMLVEKINSLKDFEGIEIHQPAPNWFTCTLETELKINKLYHLDFGSQVEVIPTLLGYLRMHSQMNIRELCRSLERYYQVDINQVIKFLSLLVANGIISGTLIDGIYNVNIHLEDSSTNLLGENNQILYGMFSTSNNIQEKTIANILQIPKEEVKKQVYDFIENSDIKVVFTRGGDVMVEDLPAIPINQSIADITDTTRALLGFCMLTNDLDMKNMSKIFNLDKTEILRNIYLLIGMGYIKKINIKKDKLENLEIAKIYPSDNFIADPYFALLNSHEEINLEEKAKEMQSETNSLLYNLTKIIPSGYFPHAILKDTLIQRGDKVQLNSCGCGSDISDTTLPCVNCGKTLPQCMVCRIGIFSSERKSFCGFCEQVAHHNHLAAWLHIKKECPHCRHQLNNNEILEELK